MRLEQAGTRKSPYEADGIENRFPECGIRCHSMLENVTGWLWSIEGRDEENIIGKDG